MAGSTDDKLADMIRAKSQKIINLADLNRTPSCKRVETLKRSLMKDPVAGVAAAEYLGVNRSYRRPRGGEGEERRGGEDQRHDGRRRQKIIISDILVARGDH